MRPDRAAVNDLQCAAGSPRGIRRLLPTPAADTSTRDSCRATRFSRAPAAFRPAAAATRSGPHGPHLTSRRRFRGHGLRPAAAGRGFEEVQRQVASVFADIVGVAPARGPVDLDGVGGHSPAPRAAKLDSAWNVWHLKGGPVIPARTLADVSLDRRSGELRPGTEAAMFELQRLIAPCRVHRERVRLSPSDRRAKPAPSSGSGSSSLFSVPADHVARTPPRSLMPRRRPPSPMHMRLPIGGGLHEDWDKIHVSPLPTCSACRGRT